jgi:hypothetical protein
MVKKDYNKQDTPKGIDPHVLEKSLGEWLEPEAKRCLETLLTRPQDLIAEDSAIIMAYLEHQRICVPRQAETAKHSIRDVLLHLALQAPPDSIPSEAKTALMTGAISIEIKDHFRFHFMKMASGVLIPYFARMEWEIVGTEEGSSFITSDSPVSFINVGCPPPLEPGIGLVGTQVFFPLDSQPILILWHPEYKDNTALPPLEPIPDPVLADGRIHLTYEKRYPKELVNLTNSIIFSHAEKIIVGSSKEILENAADRA